MTSVGTKDKLEFAYLMAKHSDATLHQLQRIMRYGASYKRWSEEACNRELTPQEEKRWINIANRILALCSEFNAQAKLQNDPRGATIKIQVPDGYTNDWGREGICVPTS